MTALLALLLAVSGPAIDEHGEPIPTWGFTLGGGPVGHSNGSSGAVVFAGLRRWLSSGAITGGVAGWQRLYAREAGGDFSQPVDALFAAARYEHVLLSAGERPFPSSSIYLSAGPELLRWTPAGASGQQALGLRAAAGVYFPTLSSLGSGRFGTNDAGTLLSLLLGLLIPLGLEVQVRTGAGPIPPTAALAVLLEL